MSSSMALDAEELVEPPDDEFTKVSEDRWEIDFSKLQVPDADADADAEELEVKRGLHGMLYRSKYGGSDVAVKFLDWGLSTPPDQIAHLRSSLREVADAWHHIDHPNIAMFYGASIGTTDVKILENLDSSLSASACCVVVEYLAGGTLRDHLMKHAESKLAYKDVVGLALAMARGISYLHLMRIVHRDVKMENMLLDGKGNLKVVDFGVARIKANPKEMTGKKGSTPRYMAPEVLKGKPYDYKCDVYSFGICLWEIYCCQTPYMDEDASIADLSLKIVKSGLRPKIPRCCPRDMARIMRKCWDANPKKRPEMDEVVRRLEALDTTKDRGMAQLNSPPAAGCFCMSLGRRSA